MEDRFLTLSRESKLASEVFRHVDPLNFYDNFLKEGIRPDGRKLCSYRKFKVNDLFTAQHYRSNLAKHCRPAHRTPLNGTDSATKIETDQDSDSLKTQDLADQVLGDKLNKNVLVSSVYLSSGNSKYHCKITGDLVTVEFDVSAHGSNEPGAPTTRDYSSVSKKMVNYGVYDLFEGGEKKTFEVDVTIPKHVVSEIYDLNGPCINISHFVSHFLENVLNSPEVVPKDQFCFSNSFTHSQTMFASKGFSGKEALWRFRVEIMCDEYDGNLMDMCFLACTHALLNAKLPFVVYYKNSFTFLNLDLNPAQDGLDKEVLTTVEENVPFLLSQLNQNAGPGAEAVGNNQLLQALSTNGFKRIHTSYLPLTVTFCKCSNFLLLDPTREDEQIGLNFTVYAPLRQEHFWREHGMSIDGDENRILKQPVNLSGLRVSDDTLERMYKVVDELVPCLLEQ